VATPKQPTDTPDLVPGPPLSPAGPLLEWLEGVKAAAGPRKLLRLPVVVRFEDDYRLALSEAVVGVSEAAFDDAEALRLKLDDTGMGVSLLEAVKRLCTGLSCAVWLEGHWGTLLTGPLARRALAGAGTDPRHPFAVLRVQGTVGAGEAGEAGEDVRVLVEPPAP